MRIATVTLNPAIDMTVRVDGFQTNTVNRGQTMQFDAGGKGVNVASFLADYGHATALTGNLPPGAPATIYATIITQLKRHGKQVVLDTSGQALREGARAGPTVVKPNVDEMQQLTGQSLPDEAA